jgi:hypothetical protein
MRRNVLVGVGADAAAADADADEGVRMSIQLPKKMMQRLTKVI